MKQEQIDYSEIIASDFTEEGISDSCYEAKHGYKYVMITKSLTKNIYLEWAKETRLCQMVRIDGPEKGNIKARTPIINLGHLDEIIDFFSDELEYCITNAC
jgi:hypothetical protein